MTLPYGPTLDSLIREAPPMPLGPGTPENHPTVKLGELTVEAAFADHDVANPAQAQLCLAALLLRYNHLEAAHGLVQAEETPDHAYWHAILHRREPDPGNAKYWLMQVGDHPVFPAILAAAQGSSLHQPFHDWDTWQPGIFTDLCDENRDSGSDYERACLEIQEAEWQALFAHCFAKAIGQAKDS